MSDGCARLPWSGIDLCPGPQVGGHSWSSSIQRLSTPMRWDQGPYAHLVASVSIGRVPSAAKGDVVGPRLRSAIHRTIVIIALSAFVTTLGLTLGQGTAQATVQPELTVTPTSGPVGTFVTVQYGPAGNGCGSPAFQSTAGFAGGVQILSTVDHGVVSFVIPRALASPSPHPNAPVVPGNYQFTLICDTSNNPATALTVVVAFTVTPPRPRYVGLAPVAGATGYRLARSDGDVHDFGSAGALGSLVGAGITPVAPIVGIAPTPDHQGYWLVAADGGVFTFGDAPFSGSIGGEVLNQPVVGMAPTADGHGYWLVASDGGVFTFGDAHFYGSMSGKPLNQPVVGMAPTADGQGYWLVAADGGVFTFGDAVFQGSMGAARLNQPVVGMASDAATGGYWLVAADGGVFSFAAPFFGSTGGLRLNEPVTGMASTPDSAGYWLVAADGGVFTFGDALFSGSGA
jgi:hypothetical protein